MQALKDVKGQNRPPTPTVLVILDQLSVSRHIARLAANSVYDRKDFATLRVNATLDQGGLEEALRRAQERSPVLVIKGLYNDRLS